MNPCMASAPAHSSPGKPDDRSGILFVIILASIRLNELKKIQSRIFPCEFPVVQSWPRPLQSRQKAKKADWGYSLHTEREQVISLLLAGVSKGKVLITSLDLKTFFFCFSPWLWSLKLPPLKLKPLPSFPIPLWFGVWVRITVRFQKMILSTGGKLRDRGTGYIWGHWRVQPRLSLKFTV